MNDTPAPRPSPGKGHETTDKQRDPGASQPALKEQARPLLRLLALVNDHLLIAALGTFGTVFAAGFGAAWSLRGHQVDVAKGQVDVAKERIDLANDRLGVAEARSSRIKRSSSTFDAAELLLTPHETRKRSEDDVGYGQGSFYVNVPAPSDGWQYRQGSEFDFAEEVLPGSSPRARTQALLANTPPVYWWSSGDARTVVVKRRVDRRQIELRLAPHVVVQVFTKQDMARMTAAVVQDRQQLIAWASHIEQLQANTSKAVPLPDLARDDLESAVQSVYDDDPTGFFWAALVLQNSQLAREFEGSNYRIEVAEKKASVGYLRGAVSLATSMGNLDWEHELICVPSGVRSERVVVVMVRVPSVSTDRRSTKAYQWTERWLRGFRVPAPDGIVPSEDPPASG